MGLMCTDNSISSVPLAINTRADGMAFREIERAALSVVWCSWPNILRFTVSRRHYVIEWVQGPTPPSAELVRHKEVVNV